MDLENTGTWPSKKVVKEVRPECAWHIDPTERDASDGFTLHVHRLSTDPLDQRPSMSIDVALVAMAGEEERAVETQTLAFRPMGIRSPMFECLVAAGQALAPDDLNDLERPPWMDPPDKEPGGLDIPGLIDRPIEIDRPRELGPLPRPP